MRTSVWVAVVCTSSARVLLALRSDATRNGGQWNFFGGGVDRGERPVKTALRELVEEAGLQAVAADLVPLGEAMTPAKRNLLYGLPVDDEFEPALNHEHDDWRWVAVDALHAHGALHAPTGVLVEHLERWVEDGAAPRPPEIESRRDFQDRFSQALLRFLGKDDAEGQGAA